MKTRLITAFFGVVLCVLVMIFGDMAPVIYAIALALVNALCCMEFLTAKKLTSNISISVLTLLFSVSMPLVICSDLWYLPIFIYSLMMMASLIFFRNDNSVADISFAFFGTVIISLSVSCLSRLVCMSGGWHSFYLIMGLVGAWLADSCAYFSGVFLGKRKLCPSISPKKTVEGAIGGAIGAVVFTLIAGLIFEFIVYRNIHVNYLALLVTGIYCAFASVIGDLSFSCVKRECGIKDYGSIMPGHGGMLDRFDSVIFCVPFVFFISETWGLIV